MIYSYIYENKRPPIKSKEISDMKHSKQDVRIVKYTTDNRVVLVSDCKLNKSDYFGYYTVRSTSKGKCITVKGNRYYLHDIKSWDKTFEDVMWHEPNVMN